MPAQGEIQSGSKPFGIKKRFTPPFFQLVSDLAAIILSYLVQYYVRFETDIIDSHIQPDIAALIITGTVFTIYWLTLFFFSGLYKNWYIRSPFDEFFTVFRVIFFGCAFIVFVVLLDSENAPRYLFLIYFPLFTFFVLLGRFIARRIQVKLRNKQIISIPSLIVGTSNKAFELYKKLEASPAWGFKANGFLLLRNGEEAPDIEKMQNSGLPVFRGIENLKEVLGNLTPEEVLISAGNYNHSQLMRIASDCADMNIAVKIEPDMYNIFSGQTKTLHIYGIPLIEVSSQLMKPWQEILKRDRKSVV